MKTVIGIFSIFILFSTSFAQNIGINETGVLPDPSAGLDIQFNDKGLLLPRMTTNQRDAIVNPAHSLLIFNTTIDCFESYNSTNSSWDSFGCFSAPPSPIFTCGDLLQDARDGNTYSTVQIGSQCWMKENLAYLPSVSPASTNSATIANYYVYDYNGTDVNTAKAQPNYSTYGVLYNWVAAVDNSPGSSANPSGIQGACPSGWHLPSDDEWKDMESFLGMAPGDLDVIGDGRGTTEGGDLKETGTTHWNAPNTGATNNSGFTALPAGRMSNSFIQTNAFGFFWTATEYNSSNATERYLYASASWINRGNYPKQEALSVRCVMD